MQMRWLCGDEDGGSWWTDGVAPGRRVSELMMGCSRGQKCSYGPGGEGETIMGKVRGAEMARAVGVELWGCARRRQH